MEGGSLGSQLALHYRTSVTEQETKFSGESVLVCPSCGENNAPNFRFCGMCGTRLEPARPPAAPMASAQPARAREIPAAGQTPNPAPANTFPRASESTVGLAGPSLLGLNEEAETSRASEAALRNTFTSADYYSDPEEPHNGRRVLLLLVLLGGLGAAGWWTYKNYLGAMSAPRPSANATPAPTPNPANPPPTEPPATTTPVKPEAPTVPPASAAEISQPATSTPNAAAQQEQSTAQPPKEQSPPKAAANAATRPAAEARTTHARPVREATLPAAKVTPESAADNGNADFRKGEAYLYGRGVAENCDQAVKYLKEASAQQNAKARSTFGTMFATGHCVPRDLPSSYGWFALALRVDPNNQILEKDLTAVWNQMTPPERESATKFKP